MQHLDAVQPAHKEENSVQAPLDLCMQHLGQTRSHTRVLFQETPAVIGVLFQEMDLRFV